MRFSSIRYLIREGFRNIWQNRFMAIASIGVLMSCLLITGRCLSGIPQYRSCF